jgi:Uma2 family endonuclease
VPHLPDLAVEIQSPSNTVKEMHRKAEYYLTHGTKMVWVVYAEVQAVEVVTDSEITLLSVCDTLTADDILPDFGMPVANIFA